MIFRLRLSGSFQMLMGCSSHSIYKATSSSLPSRHFSSPWLPSPARQTIPRFSLSTDDFNRVLWDDTNGGLEPKSHNGRTKPSQLSPEPPSTFEEAKEVRLEYWKLTSSTRRAFFEDPIWNGVLAGDTCKFSQSASMNYGIWSTPTFGITFGKTFPQLFLRLCLLQASVVLTNAWPYS